jgi:molybdopterin converting factor small subunit
MEVKVLSFGNIAEYVSPHTLEVFEGTTLKELRQIFFNKYPALIHIPFSIAVDKVIRDEAYVIVGFSEVALLPPFSGG